MVVVGGGVVESCGVGFVGCDSEVFFVGVEFEGAVEVLFDVWVLGEDVGVVDGVVGCGVPVSFPSRDLKS